MSVLRRNAKRKERMPKGKKSGKLAVELTKFGVGAFLNKVTGIRLRLRRTKEDNLEFLKKDYNP